MHEKLTALIEQLAARADETGGWTISPEEVAGILGVGQVPFWRAIHETRDRIAFADAIDGWSADSVGDLVTVLERLLGVGPEEMMARAGLFVPHPRGIELTEELLFRARRLAAAHEVRVDDLAAMLRYTGTVRGAIEIYFDTHIDLEALVDGSAESFRVLQGMPAVGRATARRYLQRMFARHVLDRRALLAGLEERLRLAAAQLGFIDPEDRARASDAPDSEGRKGSPRHAWAKKVMGFGGHVVTPDALRARYRELMMRHHPDVDPSGLERCKDVNVAYSLLIAEAATPS
ncbi:MAG: J domain-containing protein [Spirochaetia bacterium]